jgi:hypothetical protein
VLARFDYEHPIMDQPAIDAQRALPEIQGRRRLVRRRLDRLRLPRRRPEVGAAHRRRLRRRPSMDHPAMKRQRPPSWSMHA